MHRPLYRSFSLFVLALGAAGTPQISATNYSIVTQADDLTVNGNCTLREALAAAEADVTVDLCPASSPGSVDIITLGAGTYLLPLGALALQMDDEIQVQGPPTQPPTAVISGGDTHRIFQHSGEGRLTLQDLEIRDGRELTTSQPMGGAVRVFNGSLTVRRVVFVGNVARSGGAIGWVGTGPACSLVVEFCRFEQNQAQNPTLSAQAQGGALWADATSGAEIRISDSVFAENRASSALANDVASGGAILLFTEGSGSSVTVERLRLVDNIAEATGSGSFANAGGIWASLMGSTVRMEDLSLQGNGRGLSPTNGSAALFLFFLSSSNVTLDRLSLIGNGDPATTNQAVVSAHSQSVVRLRDTLIAGGGEGLAAAATGNATLRLDHLTVTDNAVAGLVLGQETNGSLVVENSIVYGNGTDIFIDSGAPLVAPENLVGVDPMFTDAAGGDYTLASGSPAVDTGNTASTFMGPYDLAHGARIVGSETDLGAFERGGIFNDGFEAGSAGSWEW